MFHLLKSTLQLQLGFNSISTRFQLELETGTEKRLGGGGENRAKKSRRQMSRFIFFSFLFLSLFYFGFFTVGFLPICFHG